MGAKVFGILAVVVLLGFGIYILRTVSMHGFFVPSASSTFSLAPKFMPLGRELPIGTPPPPVSNPTTRSNKGGGTSTSAPVIPQNIPSGYTAQTISPYFDKIQITSATGRNSGANAYQELGLSGVGLGSSDRIDITGWYIKAFAGGQYIPQAVQTYTTGSTNSEGDIILSKADTLRLYFTPNAIERNFYLNKCMGYLADFQNLYPIVSKSCPYITQSSMSNLSGQCQNYVSSLGTCQIPASNPPISESDYSCRQFLSTLNYNGCFAAHSNDADFYSHEWHVLTASQFIDPSHDTVSLLDSRGLLVSQYTF